MSDLRPFDDWPDKEKLFAHEYLIDNCMKSAAIRAGYSARSAGDTGCKIYHKPYMKAWIEEKLKDKCEKLSVTADSVIAELASLGFMSRHEVLGEQTPARMGGDPDEQPVLPPLTLSMTMRMSDKIKSLELLGKHLKLWTDKVDVSDNRSTVIRRDLTGKKKVAD